MVLFTLRIAFYALLLFGGTLCVPDTLTYQDGGTLNDNKETNQETDMVMKVPGDGSLTWHKERNEQDSESNQCELITPGARVIRIIFIVLHIALGITAIILFCREQITISNERDYLSALENVSNTGADSSNERSKSFASKSASRHSEETRRPTKPHSKHSSNTKNDKQFKSSSSSGHSSELPAQRKTNSSKTQDSTTRSTRRSSAGYDNYDGNMQSKPKKRRRLAWDEIEMRRHGLVTRDCEHAPAPTVTPPSIIVSEYPRFDGDDLHSVSIDLSSIEDSMVTEENIASDSTNSYDDNALYML